jgi:WhiB family transcriptional regulator, redox-sensing transcriptional regulator
MTTAAVDTAWRDQAKCQNVQVNLFFPDGNGAAIEEIQAAKSLCESCEARSACLEFALVTNQEAGIWGGTTEAERRRLRRVWLAARRLQKGALARAS